MPTELNSIMQSIIIDEVIYTEGDKFFLKEEGALKKILFFNSKIEEVDFSSLSPDLNNNTWYIRNVEYNIKNKTTRIWLHSDVINMIEYELKFGAYEDYKYHSDEYETITTYCFYLENIDGDIELFTREIIPNLQKV